MNGIFCTGWSWSRGCQEKLNESKHHEKSIVSCVQVTSKSTKVPLYSAMSLLYKRQLIVHGERVSQERPGKRESIIEVVQYLWRQCNASGSGIL
jgi:hypothetical protein